MNYKNLPPGKYYWDKNQIINDEYINIDILENLSCGTGEYWRSYRLGDTVGGKYNKKFETIEQKWPNSIKDKYMKLAFNKANKYDILFSVIKAYPLYTFNTTNFIFIGIRVGDVMGGNILTNYVINEDYYKNLDLNKYLNKTCIICCGSHYNTNTPYTIKYVNTLYKIMKNKGFENVFVRAGNNPDDDFTLMCGSDYLIHGLGSYHKMIRNMVIEYGTKGILN